jgi:hypothetical protein
MSVKFSAVISTQNFFCSQNYITVRRQKGTHYSSRMWTWRQKLELTKELRVLHVKPMSETAQKNTMFFTEHKVPSIIHVLETYTAVALNFSLYCTH